MTYMLYRHRTKPDTYCAVPAGRPVPRLIERGPWDVHGLTKPGEARPPGFEDEPARYAVAMQGFYPFRHRPLTQLLSQRV